MSTDEIRSLETRRVHRGGRTGHFFVVLRRLPAMPVLSVDQPMKELGVARRPPVVGLASCDVGVQIGERVNVHRLDGRDLGEAFDLPAGESNLMAEADHEDVAANGLRAILAELQGLVCRSARLRAKISQA